MEQWAGRGSDGKVYGAMGRSIGRWAGRWAGRGSDLEVFEAMNKARD